MTPINTQIRFMLSRCPDGVVLMPPEIAKRIVDECGFIGQRDIKNHRLAKLAAIIKSGYWRGDIHPITIANIVSTGRMTLVNGHHRCTFIANHTTALSIRVIVVDVETEDEARKLYKQFDDPLSSRTVSEVLSAELIPQKMGLGKHQAQFLFKAVATIRANFDIGLKHSKNAQAALTKDRSEISNEMLSWGKEATTYFGAVSMANPAIKTKMTSVGMMSIGIYTLRHQPGKANEFWTTLANNDGLRRDDPRSVLINDTWSRSLNTGSKMQAVIAPSLAWNAWYENRDLKIIKIPKNAHLRIAGTPFKWGEQ